MDWWMDLNFSALCVILLPFTQKIILGMQKIFETYNFTHTVLLNIFKIYEFFYVFKKSFLLRL